MRSYKHLWEPLLSDDNIYLACKNYLRGRTKDKGTKNLFKNNPELAIKRAREYAKNYELEEHTSKVIKDGTRGKIRTIIRPKCQEQVLHHMVVNIIKPIFMRPMYQHSHGSIPERGCVSGKKTMSKWIKKSQPKYFLKMDIKKYFENIPHSILKAKLAKVIKDERVLNILYDFIDVKFDGAVNYDKGIPLGFYSSQWFANFYLTDFDHFVKERLHAKHYMRYMDDMIVLDDDKDKLLKIKNEIEKYLKNELKLILKENWQIVELTNSRAIDFMGFRFYKNRTTLRRNLLYRLTRKARRIYKRGATIFTARQFLSLAGWTKHASVYRVYEKLVAPFCSKRKMRSIVSNYDRRRSYAMV